MWKSLKNEFSFKTATLLFIALTIWWFLSPTFGSSSERFLGDFPSIYAILALLGAISGILISYRWGGTRSVIGRAILMFSFGLFAQVFGQIAYAFMSFYLHIDVPYPSIGDIGYFGSIPLYIAGVFYLAKASGVKVNLQSFKHQLIAIIIPLLTLIGGYALFLRGYEFDWTNLTKILLDFGYPLGQALYISLAILTYLLSRGVLGGKMKNRILFILGALCIQFFSDYTFLYQSSRGTWTAGGVNDYMYLTAYFLMTVGLISFKKLEED